MCRSIWAQIRDPLWWILTAVKLTPLYGIQPIFFIVLFLLMDHRDEFLLCRFILAFKGSQFITLAIVNLLLGSFWYYTSPQSQVDWPISVYSTCLFVAQILVTWTAFLLLPCSREKGKKVIVDEDGDGYHDEEPSGTCCGIERTPIIRA